jgi:hypothetical protein
MTKKLSVEQKKFNALISALNKTWNCDYICNKCPFRMKDVSEVKEEDCGAREIRKYASLLFKERNKKEIERIE